MAQKKNTSRVQLTRKPAQRMDMSFVRANGQCRGFWIHSKSHTVQDLQEIKLADLPSRKVTGTSYGAQYHDPEGDDDADNKKPAKAADAPKRGRGRPAGSMSGARQQGSAKQRKTGGVDYTGYKLHLPNNNK